MSELRAGCWPDAVSSNPCWADAEASLKDEAADVAAAILWYGTGGQFDLCPVVHRPCQTCMCGCASNAWVSVGLVGGQWRNWMCGGCGDFCRANSLRLPSPAYDVVSVNVNGDTLDPALYRVDRRRELVRMDGKPWPHHQDMNALPGAPGTVTVTYVQSRLDAAGLRAYGTLAGELLAAWVAPTTCRLPQGIKALTREGVTVDFDVLGELANRTGIVEVDLWLRMVNPTGTPHAQSIVMSPDTLRRRGRTTTWGS